MSKTPFDPADAQALNAPLGSDRLVLEPLTLAHADALFESFRDDAIYEWISIQPSTSVDQLRTRWARLSTRLHPDGQVACLDWAVRRAGDGAYVGSVDARVEGTVVTNLGYMFFPAFWGQGHASEAVGVVLEHFAASGIREVWATVTKGNLASCRVLEKNGFVHTRVIPGNDLIRGVKRDDLEYVRLLP